MSWKKVIYAEKRSCENKEKRLLSTNQGKRLWKKPALPTPCFQISSLQNYEQTGFSCLSHLVYGVLCCGSPSELKQSLRDSIRK